jgi:hypothetical protein
MAAPWITLDRPGDRLGHLLIGPLRPTHRSSYFVQSGCELGETFNVKFDLHTTAKACGLKRL